MTSGPYKSLVDRASVIYMADPNMSWDGRRWLRYDGQQWLDAESGLPIAAESQDQTFVTPPQVPTPGSSATSKNTMLMIVIGGAVALVLALLVGVVAIAGRSPSTPPVAAPPASASTPAVPTPAVPTPSPPATTAPADVSAVVSAISSVDTELDQYNKSVKKSGRSHNYKAPLADLDQAQRNVATVHTLAATIEWPVVQTDTMATAAQIAAYEAAATQWIDIQREIVIGIEACFRSGAGTQACVDRVGKRTQAREVAAAASYRAAWIALGGVVK